MPNVFNGVSRRCSRLGKALQVGIAVAVMSGCAAQSHQGGNNVGTMQGAAALGPEISTFLDNATPGSIAAFPKSPWGSNVSVIVQERYFAGSGRLCAHLDVARQGTTPVGQTGNAGNTAASARMSAGFGAQQAQVACLIPDSGWYAQRLVTQVLVTPSNR